MAAQRDQSYLVEDVKLVGVVFIKHEPYELAGRVDVDGAQLPHHPLILRVLAH